MARKDCVKMSLASRRNLEYVLFLVVPLTVVWSGSCGFLYFAFPYSAREEKFLIVFVVGLAILSSWMAIRNSRIFHILKERGYTWVGYRESARLLYAVGRRAYLIPRAEEMALIPGYEEGNIKSVIRIMERL